MSAAPPDQHSLAEAIQHLRDLLGDQQEGPDVLDTLTNCITEEARGTRSIKRYYAALDECRALIDAPY